MWFLRGWFLCFTGFSELFIFRRTFGEMAERSRALVLITDSGLSHLTAQIRHIQLMSSRNVGHFRMR